VCVCDVQLQAAFPPDKRLENEAERVRLRDLLVDMATASSCPADGPAARRSSTASSLRGISAGGGSASKRSSMKERCGSTSGSASGSGAALAAVPAEAPVLPAGPAPDAPAGDDAAAAVDLAPGVKRTPLQPKLPELVSGHYLLDFGSVTKGINKQRKVKLTNLSAQQACDIEAGCMRMSAC
jgi:hypothetical protein